MKKKKTRRHDYCTLLLSIGMRRGSSHKVADAATMMTKPGIHTRGTHSRHMKRKKQAPFVSFTRYSSRSLTRSLSLCARSVTRIIIIVGKKRRRGSSGRSSTQHGLHVNLIRFINEKTLIPRHSTARFYELFFFLYM